MRWATLVGLLIVLGFGCASSGGQSRAARGVQELSLRDPRLPIEARRWLADAEDEVAIARAHVDDTDTELNRLVVYRGSIIVRLEDTWSASKGGAAAEGEEASWAFVKYADERVALAELELTASKKVLELASLRLTQSRAETAMRYDLAVYEMEPIVLEVEQLRDEVAAIQKEVEQQRAVVDKAADTLWRAFAKYVNKGGVSNSLWGLDAQ